MKLFRIWILLSILSLLICTLVFIFGKNSIDAVEEATVRDIVPLLSIQGADNEQKIEMFEKKLGIDSDKSLYNALKNNPEIESFTITNNADSSLNTVIKHEGYDSIIVKSISRNGYGIEMAFLVLPKKFFKIPSSQIKGLLSYKVSHNNRTYSVTQSNLMPAMIGLFANDKNKAGEVVVGYLEKNLIEPKPPEEIKYKTKLEDVFLGVNNCQIQGVYYDPNKTQPNSHPYFIERRMQPYKIDQGLAYFKVKDSLFGMQVSQLIIPVTWDIHSVTFDIPREEAEVHLFNIFERRFPSSEKTESGEEPALISDNDDPTKSSLYCNERTTE